MQTFDKNTFRRGTPRRRTTEPMGSRSAMAVMTTQTYDVVASVASGNVRSANRHSIKKTSGGGEPSKHRTSPMASRSAMAVLKTQTHNIVQFIKETSVIFRGLKKCPRTRRSEDLQRFAVG